MPAPYLPFTGETRRSEFRWRLGLHPLDPADWIELEPAGEAAIEAKDRLLRTRPEEVRAWLDEIESEAREVADALAEHLRGRWPQRADQVRIDADLHPLEAAARLVPEDLVLLAPRDGRLVVVGGVVCFPNRWDLRSKLGRTLAETHAPVPRLNAQLGERLDRFLDRLSAERGFWRLGWGLIDTPEWFAPPVAREADARPSSSAELYLRVERETIRRLPRTGAVLFTIRTHVTALADAVADPGTARHLAERLAQMPPDVRSYKGVADVADQLIDRLRRWQSTNLI